MDDLAESPRPADPPLSPSSGGSIPKVVTVAKGPRVSRRDSDPQLRPPVGLVAGAAYGTAAAVLYTLSNIALRDSVAVNPFLVSAVKAAPTVLCLTPFLAWMMWKGTTVYTSLKMAPRFALVALLGQFVGNAAFQWALGSIGLAVSVPITLGTMLIGGAILGRVILNEPVHWRSIVAIVLLISAVIVLSSARSSSTQTRTAQNPEPGASSIMDQDSTDSSKHAIPPWAGALCATASGAAYALFGTVMRQAMSHGMSAPLTMWISGMVGTVSLWMVTWITIDTAEWSALTPVQWQTMAVAGAFNFLAFIALSLALKALPVVAVNLINASQVAMAAVAGIVLFGESITAPLLVGISLTFLGLFVLTTRKRPRRRAGETLAPTHDRAAGGGTS